MERFWYFASACCAPSGKHRSLRHPAISFFLYPIRSRHQPSSRPTLCMQAHLLAALFLFAPAQSPQNSGPDTLSSTAQSPTGTTVSVPIHERDPATVTGTLALRHRAGKQFLVLESPTPFRLLFASGVRPKVVRDLEIHLPGQDTAIAAYAGQVLTASGSFHLATGPSTWNGAVIRCRLILLPGGKQLHANPTR